MKFAALVALVVPLVVVFVIALPHVGIWAINVLFDLTLPHDLGNWFAFWVLIVIVASPQGAAGSK